MTVMKFSSDRLKLKTEHDSRFFRSSSAFRHKIIGDYLPEFAPNFSLKVHDEFF